MDRIATKTNPKMFDKAVLPIQTALADTFAWLDYVIGICETLVERKEGRAFRSASFYSSGYEQIMPCEELGNFSFFYLRDPQVVARKDSSLVRSPFSLVLWYDITDVLPTSTDRNTEQVKGHVMAVLNDLHLPYLTIEKIWENPKNVFADFDYDPTANQYLMHPYTGLRIDGILTTRLECVTR